MPFDSLEFRRFTRKWGIKQSTSSPGFAQSNGKSERFIQTLKRMMKKADDDIYLTLLEYRNTPVTGTSFSPAQILMSRTLRSNILVTKQLLKPAIVDPRAQLMQQKLKRRVYYDRPARSLANLQLGDTVCIRRKNTWQLAIVTKVDLHPRSYWVDNVIRSGLHRNRRHLLRMNEPPPVLMTPEDDVVTPREQEPVVTSNTTCVDMNSGAGMPQPATPVREHYTPDCTHTATHMRPTVQHTGRGGEIVKPQK